MDEYRSSNVNIIEREEGSYVVYFFNHEGTLNNYFICTLYAMSSF